MTRDGGGWTLIGKGREGWTWADSGQGSATAITDVTSFGVVALPAATVSSLVGGVQQSSLVSGVRIVRSSGVNNTATVKTGDSGAFSWGRFDGSAGCGGNLATWRGSGEWKVGSRNTVASMNDSNITNSGVTCFRANAAGNIGECAPMSTVWIRD
jgi:hypothetical protein